MESLIFILLIPVVIAAGMGVHAYASRLKNGHFEIVLDSPDLFRFETDVGSFELNRKQGRLNFIAEHGQGHCKLAEINHIGFEIVTEYALFHEIIFGFDLTDVLKQYRDQHEHYIIHIKSNEGINLPVYIASQYRPKEFMQGWYFELTEFALAKLGLFRYGFKRSRAVHQVLWRVFQKFGVDPAQPRADD